MDSLFCKQFIKGFSTVMAPITDYLKKVSLHGKVLPRKHLMRSKIEWSALLLGVSPIFSKSLK